MQLNLKVTFDRSLWLGILASLVGGIPVVIIMNTVGMFEKLAAFLGLGESLWVGLVVHFLISFIYGLPFGAAVYYLQNYHYPEQSIGRVWPGVWQPGSSLSPVCRW